MNNKLIFIVIGAFLSITLAGIANENRNPFEDLESSSGGGFDAYPDGDAIEGAHPLQKHPVENYTLMALITSKKGDIAMVRAENGEEFFVRINDLLGNADGKITDINARGIEVSEKNKIVSLLVRNRSIGNDKN
jgi:Tfp pilus assembly protein PilP